LLRCAQRRYPIAVSDILTPRQLVRQSGLTLAQQSFGALCALGTTILMARTLGPAAQGLFNVAASTAMLVGLSVNLGTPAATAYAVSRGSVAPRRAGFYSIGIALGLGGLGAACLGLAAALGRHALWPGVPTAVLVAAACVIPTLLASQLLAAVLQGSQSFGRYNTMALISAASTFTCSATAIGVGFGVLGCLVSAFLGHLLAACWAVYHVRRLPPGAASAASVKQLPTDAAGNAEVAVPGQAWRYFCELLRFGILTAAANALVFASFRIDVFLLNAWVPQEAVGPYNVAASIAERLWMVSQAMEMVLFAQVARRLGRKGDAMPIPPTDDPTPIVVRHILWAVAAAAAMLWACAGWVLPLVFGRPYGSAVAPLRALLPGVVLFNVARIIGQDFAGRGHVHLNVIVGAACLSLNVVLNLLWIPSYGTLGAAWASSVSYTADSAIKLVLYCRTTQTAWHKVVLLQPGDWRRLGPQLRRAG
jgi:O-antigen/teichoic acid export membrane protein